MKFTVLFLSALAVSAADACTAVYVGKDVSADGSTILARTVDLRPITAWQRLTFEPARSAPTNLVYSVSGVSSAGVAGGFTRDWPRETFRYVGTPLATCCGMGRFLSMGMNEKGVALTVCVSAWPKRELIAADPYVPMGIAESSITEYLIAYATSARQVVGEIGAIAATHGIAEGGVQRRYPFGLIEVQ